MSLLIAPKSPLSKARRTHYENIQSIDKTLLSQSKSPLTRLFLYGDLKHNSNVNALFLNSAIEFKLSSEKFNGPLFNEA